MMLSMKNVIEKVFNLMMTLVNKLQNIVVGKIKRFLEIKIQNSSLKVLKLKNHRPLDDCQMSKESN